MKRLSGAAGRPFKVCGNLQNLLLCPWSCRNSKGFDLSSSKSHALRECATFFIKHHTKNGIT
jgi:hypothetical protein